MANLGPDDVEEKVLDAALRMARSQATVPPLEEQICPHHKNSQTCEEEVGCRRCRVAIGGQEEGSMRRGGGGGRSGFGQNEGGSPLPTDHSEDPRVDRLRARLGQLEAFPCRPVRGSVKAAEGIRSKAAKRRAVLRGRYVAVNGAGALCFWLDEKQSELRDAMDMSDMESPSAITGLITRDSPSWQVLLHTHHTVEHGGTTWVARRRGEF